MPVCPACDTSAPDGATTCPSCGLAIELFRPISEAVGLPRSDPHYTAAVHEILEAIGALPSDPPAAAAPAELANAARFPATPPPAERPTRRAKAAPLPDLPGLPAGAGLPALRQQVNEFLELGRRCGVDVSGFDERVKALAVVDDLTELEQLDRDLFRHIAGSLAGEFEALRSRHHELAKFLPPTVFDTEVEKARTTLASGDLASAQREIRRAAISLGALAEEWGPVENLVNEGEQLRQAALEFGGDPSPATAALEEGRRLARSGQRPAAEEALTRATLDLWAIVKPLLEADLARRMETILRLRSSGVDLRPVLIDLKEFGAHLQARNLSAAIETYRRAGKALDAADRSPKPPGADAGAAVKSRATVRPP
jgi:hypothetical protein